MKGLNRKVIQGMTRISPRFLPFADAATPELPLARLMRLSLFQVSVAMAVTLLNGTLNRVMIVELGVPSSLVGLMVSLPLLFAPFRALVGFKSDTHVSALGWRRVPYIWFGSMLQFGGLAIMPFALLLLSGDTTGPLWIGYVGAGLAFLLVGAGLHTTQTAGLALATDIAPANVRPRVVAFLYVMLLIGMIASSLTFGWLLSNFSQIRLIQVIQGAAALTMVLNIVALWKQEARDPSRNRSLTEENLDFRKAWDNLRHRDRFRRALVAVGLGTAAFSMQDILLEPYGGEILHLPVGSTTALTGLAAIGTLIGFMIAAQALEKGHDPYRLAGYGAAVGLVAFPAVIFSGALGSADLFRAGAALIGLGSGLFSVGTLTGVMNAAPKDQAGLALGAWGAVQATAMGLSIAAGGAISDVVGRLAVAGALGPGVLEKAAGYMAVYHIEIVLLFATLIAVGPLAKLARPSTPETEARFGLAEFPG